ncbi:hypothetical protein [Anaerocolumna cellulosilytica]
MLGQILNRISGQIIDFLGNFSADMGGGAQSRSK